MIDKNSPRVSRNSSKRSSPVSTRTSPRGSPTAKNKTLDCMQCGTKVKFDSESWPTCGTVIDRSRLCASCGVTERDIWVKWATSQSQASLAKTNKLLQVERDRAVEQVENIKNECNSRIEKQSERIKKLLKEIEKLNQNAKEVKMVKIDLRSPPTSPKSPSSVENQNKRLKRDLEFAQNTVNALQNEIQSHQNEESDKKRQLDEKFNKIKRDAKLNSERLEEENKALFKKIRQCETKTKTQNELIQQYEDELTTVSEENALQIQQLQEDLLKRRQKHQEQKQANINHRKSCQELQIQLDSALDGLQAKTKEHSVVTKKVENVRKSYEMKQMEQKEEMEQLRKKVALLTKKHQEAQQIIEVERQEAMDINEKLTAIIGQNTNLKERHDEEMSKANQEKLAADTKIRDKQNEWKRQESVLATELEGQKSQLITREEEIEQLALNLKAESKTAKDSQKKVQVLDSKIQAAMAEIREKEQMYSQMSTQMISLKAQNSDLKQELGLIQEKAGDLETQVQKSKLENERKEQEVSSTTDILHRAQEQIINLRDRLEKKEIEQEGEQIKIQCLERKHTNLANEYQQMTNKYNETTQQLAEANDRAENLQVEKQQIIQKADETIKAKEVTIQKSQTQMQNRVKSSQKDLSDLQQMNQALDQKIARIESQNKILTEKANDKTKIIKLRRAKEKIKVLRRDTEDKDQLLQAASSELQATRQKIVDQKTINAKIEAQAAKCRTQEQFIADKNAMIENLKVQLKQQQHADFGEIHNLKNQIATLESQIAHLKQEATKARIMNQLLEEDKARMWKLKKVTEENNSMKANLEQMLKRNRVSPSPIKRQASMPSSPTKTQQQSFDNRAWLKWGTESPVNSQFCMGCICVTCSENPHEPDSSVCRTCSPTSPRSIQSLSLCRLCKAQPEYKDQKCLDCFKISKGSSAVSSPRTSPKKCQGWGGVNTNLSAYCFSCRPEFNSINALITPRRSLSPSETIGRASITPYYSRHWINCGTSFADKQKDCFCKSCQHFFYFWSNPDCMKSFASQHVASYCDNCATAKNKI